MRVHSRLKHAAAGLLGSLIHRNNDVAGCWAPGLLYRDIGPAPAAIHVDLLTGTSQPDNHPARMMAARYTLSVRTALAKLSVPWDQVTRATITFQFKVEVPDPWFYFPCVGDPFLCTVVLATAQRQAAVSTLARCQRHEPNKFNVYCPPS